MRNTISNTDNVIDSRDIIERIEELNGSKVEQWVAGWNMAGYMPDSEPCTFDNFEDARDYVADILEGFADDAEDDKPEEAALFKQCAGNVRNSTESDFSFTELYRAFWVKQEADILEDEDEAKELIALEALAEEAEGYASDWHHGETLINNEYFTQYAQQLAEDIGAINADASWPNNCIDWDKAADELKQDYSAVDFDGVTYWVR